MRSLNKKILKIGLPIIGVAAFATIITCVSGALVSMPIVSMGGSTAVLPLINSLANVYNDIDIVTSAGGSGAGINAIVDGTKEMGMASKNPGIKLLSREEYDAGRGDKKSRAWCEKNIKTLTIAWDGIGIIYKPSKQISKELEINEENLAKLYAAFSGIEKIRFSDLGIEEDNGKIIPYARNGGAEISGTADAFLNDSHLDYKSSNYWQKLELSRQEKIIENLQKGSYESEIIQTAEANSQAWNRVKDGPSGSIVYLSAGFILNNKNEILNKGFKIATYKKTPLEQKTITDGYNWYRPFNLIYSINQIKSNQKIVKMLNWVLNDMKSHEIIEKEGYINLTQLQKESMGWKKNIDNNEWLLDKNNSDCSLQYSGAK